jgi:hypothetical protein
MDWAFDRREIHTKFQSKSLERKRQLCDQGVYRMKLIKLMLKKQGETVWTRLIWFSVVTGDGLL